MVRLIPFFLLIASTNVYADFDLRLLKSLVDSGQNEKAYDYALKEITDFEGTPKFDYYYAIAAIDSGHANEGVFALERVLLLDPDNYAARLELARGYFILEEYARARQEFETVLTASPPKDVTSSVNLYLDAITIKEGRYKTTQTAFVEFGFGSDSNVNSGPTIDSFDIGIFSVVLDADSQEQDDTFSELKLGYNVSSPILPGTLYFLSLNADLHNNDDNSQYNTQAYTLDTGLKFHQGKNVITLNAFAQQVQLNHDDYRTLTGLNSSWLNNLSQKSSLQLYLQLSNQDYNQQSTSDASTVLLGGSYSQKFSVNYAPVLIAGLYLAQDDPKSNTDAARESTERDYFGVNLGAMFGLSDKLSAQLSLRYQDTKYGMLSWFTGKTRRDDHFTQTLNFIWRLDRHWALSAKASVIKNSSNVELFEYDRTVLSTNLRYKLQ